MRNAVKKCASPGGLFTIGNCGAISYKVNKLSALGSLEPTEAVIKEFL